MSRRLLYALICSALIVVMALLPAAAGAAPPAPLTGAPNPIQIENARPGTPGWNLPGGSATRMPAVSRQIEGYASQISVQPGDTLALHVSTAAAYRVEIFRLGWYSGIGARRIVCLPSCASGELGRAQPTPQPDPTTGILDAGWPVTDTVAVDGTWTSGYYEAKLVLTSGSGAGQASWVPFIVRAPAGSHSAILVQASVNTWEAYNAWGGKSLYTYNSTGPLVPASGTGAAAMVSFNRPFANQIDPFVYEYNQVRWLESNGYDVSYQTDVDTDQNPASLLGHLLDVVSGHDEYWSPAMRNAWEAARAAGVNLAFLGGNIGYWQARYAAGDRTLVEYRSAQLDPDPNGAHKTVQFSATPVSRPECELLGIGYPGGLALAGDPTRSYAVTPAAASSPWFARTGLTPSTTIADSVGYEWDQVKPGCAVPAVTVLMHFAGTSAGRGSPNPADAVTYTAPSGAHVFSDGSLQLVWALDDFGHPPHTDARVQRLWGNVFDSLGAPPAAPSAPGLQSPRAATAVRSPVPFRWSAPTTSVSFTLLIDGHARAAVAAAACSGTNCSASVALPDGRHTWSVATVSATGASASSPVLAFTVDTRPPLPFALSGPRSSAVLWSPRPALRWRRAHDSSSGVAGYIVVIDGAPAAFTRKLTYVPVHPLADGRHGWSIIAVDRAGNWRASRTHRFRVDSVRLIAASRRARLRSGLKVRVDAPGRCTLVLTVRLSGQRLAAGARVTPRRAGIAAIVIRLPVGFDRVTRARLLVTVRTQTGCSVRTVSVSSRW